MASTFFIFLLLLTLSGCVKRFTRHIPAIGEPKQFHWGQRHVLLMNSNGTVEVKLSQEQNCEACKVHLKSLCETRTKQVKDCPRNNGLLGKKVKIAATVHTMHFILARKYLCLHRNKTFYAVAHTNVSNLEECAFYIVQEQSGYTSIHHFKYPLRKRDCRLKQRKAKAATTTCRKLYLRKGKGDILTATRKQSSNESRWLMHV